MTSAISPEDEFFEPDYGNITEVINKLIKCKFSKANGVAVVSLDEVERALSNSQEDLNLLADLLLGTGHGFVEYLDIYKSKGWSVDFCNRTSYQKEMSTVPARVTFRKEKGN